ncbi:MAG TPA: flavin reductase family protein [Methanosphaera sp.]|nr:flavin reductase family protein [Methanosphaera sp.]HII09191.1 flavin reductase family protein [Methanosphaera sp.]HIJ15278.1 flavin reductase family protein [Methanosphaera sp.]
MKKINIKPRAIMYPAPAVIVSAYDENGKADACTLAFATMCSHKPPCVMIAINTTAKRKTLKDILETREFVLGFPSIDQIAEADYLGMFSGHDEDKLENISWTTKKGDNVNAPVINELKVSVECKVINVVDDVGSHTQITGEIVNILADEDVLDDNGRISMELVDPIVYDDVLYDYFEIGKKKSDAFKPGLTLK